MCDPFTGMDWWTAVLSAVALLCLGASVGVAVASMAAMVGREALDQALREGANDIAGKP